MEGRGRQVAGAATHDAGSRLVDVRYATDKRPGGALSARSTHHLEDMTVRMLEPV